MLLKLFSVNKIVQQYVFNFSKLKNLYKKKHISFGIIITYLLVSKYFTFIDEIDGIIKLRTDFFLFGTLEIKLESIEKTNLDIVFLNQKK
jgi:hypothetical protein